MTKKVDTSRRHPDEQGKPSGSVQRRPRLLWANSYCLLDTSSGASISVREILHQLALRGWEITIFGATVFDNENGAKSFQGKWERIRKSKVIKVPDGSLEHQLLVVDSIRRQKMTTAESASWFGYYVSLLESFKPDLVWYYGGQPLDLLIPDEAAHRGIPSAALLVNGNFHGTRWCRDVDLLVTDSRATSEYYRKKSGLQVHPVGKFINPSKIVADKHSRRNLLFINPTMGKGGAIVVQLALFLERHRPDITIEVVESRGTWAGLVKNITARLGQPRDELSNVTVTPHVTDMRAVYGRARVLLAPSLAWESGPRVVAEALMNGIPAIVTDRGGPPEMAGKAGIVLQLPDVCYQKPFNNLPGAKMLEFIAGRVTAFYDDEKLYQTFVKRSYAVAGERHSIKHNVQRLVDLFEPLMLERRQQREER